MAKDPQPPRFKVPQQIEMPIFEQVLINNSNIEVQRSPSGDRVLTITMPIGRQILIPMNPEVAKNIGMQLAAPGIVPPSNGAPAA